jgi:hypothetical protein
MEQMMELMLPKIDSSQNESRQRKYGDNVGSQDRGQPSQDGRQPGKVDVNLKEIKEDIKTNKARIEANHEMMVKLDAHHEMLMACIGKTEATDLEANQEEMEFGTENRKFPKELVAVETGRAPNNRHTDWHLTEKGRQESKERTRGNCGSRKKLGAIRRRTTRRAGESRRKGYNVRKNQTRTNVARGRMFEKRRRVNRKAALE